MCNAIHNVNDLPRVIVEVRGGVVQAIHSDTPLNVSVLDWDNAEGDPDCAEWCQECGKECEKLAMEAEGLEEAY